MLRQLVLRQLVLQQPGPHFLAAWLAYGLSLQSEGLAVFWPASGFLRVTLPKTAEAQKAEKKITVKTE